MSDVGKVDSSKSGPAPTGPKKKGRNSDKFKEMMKSGKVRETDPEQQRQRKRQAESEEEAAAEQTTGALSQGPDVEPQIDSTFELKIGKEALSVGEASSFEPEETPSLPPPMFQPPPPVQEEEEPYPISDPILGTPQQPSYSNDRTQQDQPPTQSQAPEQRERARNPPSKKTEKAKTHHHPVHPTQKKGKTAQPKPQAKEIKPKEAPPYVPPHQLVRSAAMKPTKEEEPSAEEAVAPPLAKGSWEAVEKLEKDEGKPIKKIGPMKGESATTNIFQQSTPPPPAPPGEPLAPLAAPFAHLPPQIAQIFERMAGVMTVMAASGISETTINLDNPKFADSVFFGAQIIITEYSTAPKAFNIELLGNDKAVPLFANNAQELVAAFEAGNYTFKVNRIDTGYLPATPEIKRREVQRVKRKKAS